MKIYIFFFSNQLIIITLNFWVELESIRSMLRTAQKEWSANGLTAILPYFNEKAQRKRKNPHYAILYAS